MAISGPEPLNKLLRNMRAKDFDLVAPHLKKREFRLRHVVERPNVPIGDVVFIETGLVSIVAGTTPGPRVQIGITGVEGMTGTAVVLGAAQMSLTTSVVIAATGLTMPSSALRDVLLRSETLRDYLLLYVQAFHAQIASAALARQQQVEARLAREVLMMHDRVGGNLNLTHETLSNMLDTGRPYLTEALHKLEEHKLISTGRGKITVLNRAGLIKLANGSYGSAESEYRRLLLK
jgi:CRP-like cAMP-binding protein